MADFDLIGKVRLQLDQASLSKITGDLNNVTSRAAKKSIGLDAEFGKGVENKFRNIARSYEAMQERIRRSDRLTQSQKKKFLGRGSALFKEFEKNPLGLTEQNFKDQLQLLNQALGRQQDINKKSKQLRDLRKQATDILDPKVRGGITRSLKSLRGKSGLEFDEGLQKVSGKLKSKLAEQAAIEEQRIKQAVDSNKSLTKDLESQRKKEQDSLRKDIESRARLEDEELAKDLKRGEKIRQLYEDRAKEAVAARKKIEADAEKQKQTKSNIIATDAARSNTEILRQEEASNKKRNDQLKKNILERDKLAKQLSRSVDIEQRRRANTRSDDPAFNFGRQSALAFKRFAAFTLAAGSLYLLVDAFRDATREAIDFETQLVKLAQVSNSSISAVKGTAKIITDLSEGLGTSSRDLIESAVTIRQAGFSIKETNAALETLALTSLSPSFNDLKNTTEGLVALKSQFNTSADDFKKQFGEINAVSKAFAVESEDIVTAIRKSGGAFKVAGGDVRELIALFTAVRSTTRESADTIATGFRTIFARLQRPQIIDELKGFGIQLRNTEGDFVGPLKAIEELNRALSSVGQQGDLQFARVAEQVGGIRQISKVIPLIQQFTFAQRAANIALLGANSLEEDAAIAQTSLSNRLTKTKEKFLEFVREITINDKFKQLTNSFLNLADGVTTLAKSIAPALPTLAALFAIGQIGKAGRFIEGFRSIGGGGSSIGGFGTQLALSGAFGGRVRRGFGAGPTVGNARLSRALNIGVPLAGIGLGLAGAAGGDFLASGGPLQNRNSFIAGRTISSASTSGLGGAFTGGGLASALGIGGPAGILIGGGIAAAVGGLNAFTTALQEAQDALEESQFRPAFDALSETLSEVAAGRLSPFGRRDVLNQGLQALRDRRLNATGTEREELRGNIRQTVESLLLFQQQLLDSAKTLEDFAAAGGNDAIKFISENSVLTAKELERQRDAAFKNREREESISKRLFASQERLLQQANLINNFAAALENASIKANDAAERFSFLSNVASGRGVGVKFRGTAGFGTNTTDLGLRARSNNQIASLIGIPEISALSAQSVAVTNIRNQLPAILSEFGVKRPIGATTDDLDTFVRDRLETITKGVPNRDLTVQPIIDAIYDSISAELATQGKGQNEAIQKILSAPAQFVETIFSNAELTGPLENLFASAGAALRDRVNVFADQVADITSNEIQIRQNLANALQRQFDVLTEIAQRSSPNKFPLAALQAGRSARARALLGGNAGAIGDNPSNITTFVRNAQQIVRQRELDLQQAQSVDEQRNLIDIIVKLQGEIESASDAFEILVDNSDKIAAKFAEFDKIQLGRDQIKSSIRDFTFGGRETRNQLNLASAAASLVSANPNLFFDPTVIPDALQPVIGDFLEKFGDAPVFNGKTGKELSDLIQGIGLRNAGFPPDLIKQFLSNDPNRKQEQLLEDARKLAQDESTKRQDFLKLQSDNNKSLNDGIRDSLQDFIKDLRTNLLQDTATATQTRLGAVGVQQADLQKQVDQFKLIQSLGGSGLNVDNKAVLDLAANTRSTRGRLLPTETIDQKSRALRNATEFTSSNIGGSGGVRAARNQIPSIISRDPVFGRFASEIAVSRNKNDLLSPTKANELVSNLLSSVLPDLALTRSQKQSFTEKGTNIVSDLSDQDRVFGGQVRATGLKDAIADLLIEAAEQSRDNIFDNNEQFNTKFGKFSEQQKAFFQSIVDLPEDKFNALSEAINKLGTDAKLDKVTDQLNKLNAESAALTTTLDGLNRQINLLNGGRVGGQAAAPVGAADGGGVFGGIFTPEIQAVFQGITQSLSSFINGSSPMTQALNNFPRNVEMAGTHTVNVNINGAQAMSQMQPVIEEFVKGEIQKALTKFTLDNLPGALSYSQ